MTAASQRRELRRRAIYQALTGLPYADRVSILRYELDALGAPVGVVDAHLAQVELRERALDALRQVAALHGLPDGVAPKVREFKAGHSHIDLPATLSQVIDAFGLFRTAQDVYLGGNPPDTAAASARRRQAAGRQRSHDDYIVPVSIWLDEQPAARTTRAFDRWVPEYNRTLGTDEPPAVLSATIRAQLGLGWEETKMLAGDSTASLRSRVGATRFTDTGPLLGTGGVADILGLTERLAYIESRKPGFPTRVATMARAALYLRDDVLAYSQGAPIPDRMSDELDDHVYFARDLAAFVGISLDSIRAYISKRRFSLIPAPAGRAGGRHWWWREEAERFRAEIQSPRARLRRTPHP